MLVESLILILSVGGLDAAYDELRQKQTNLLHDFDIVSQIASLVSCLKLKYKVVNCVTSKDKCCYLYSELIVIDRYWMTRRSSSGVSSCRSTW